MSSLTYRSALSLFLGGGDWRKDTFEVALVSSLYKPKLAHKTMSYVVGELTEGGVRRQKLTGRSIVVVGDHVAAHADNVVFRGLYSDETYRWAVVFRSRSRGAETDLVCAIDMMGNVPLRDIKEHMIKWGSQEKSGPVFGIALKGAE